MANQVFKDPYLFDFLGTAEVRKESELENKLIEHLEKFLLELGQGFAFVGRQVHMEVGGDDFYIDLLFYHLKLRCYVVIELKAGKFSPGHVSQLTMYMNIVDDMHRPRLDITSKDCRQFNILLSDHAELALGPLWIAELSEHGLSLPIEWCGIRVDQPSIKDLSSAIKKSFGLLFYIGIFSDEGNGWTVDTETQTAANKLAKNFFFIVPENEFKSVQQMGQILELLIGLGAVRQTSGELFRAIDQNQLEIRREASSKWLKNECKEAIKNCEGLFSTQAGILLNASYPDASLKLEDAGKKIKAIDFKILTASSVNSLQEDSFMELVANILQIKNLIIKVCPLDIGSKNVEFECVAAQIGPFERKYNSLSLWRKVSFLSWLKKNFLSKREQLLSEINRIIKDSNELKLVSGKPFPIVPLTLPLKAIQNELENALKVVGSPSMTCMATIKPEGYDLQIHQYIINSQYESAWGRLSAFEIQFVSFDEALGIKDFPYVLLGSKGIDDFTGIVRKLVRASYQNGTGLIIINPPVDTDMGNAVDAPVPFIVKKRKASSFCKPFGFDGLDGENKYDIWSDGTIEFSLSSGVMGVDDNKGTVLLKYQPRNTSGAVFITTLKLLSYSGMTNETDRESLLKLLLTWKNKQSFVNEEPTEDVTAPDESVLHAVAILSFSYGSKDPDKISAAMSLPLWFAEQLVRMPKEVLNSYLKSTLAMLRDREVDQTWLEDIDTIQEEVE